MISSGDSKALTDDDRMKCHKSRILLLHVLAFVPVGTACNSKKAEPAQSVTEAWGRNRAPSQATAAKSAQPKPTSSPAGSAVTVALVNDQPIGREQFLELLVRSRGAVILEQLVSLSVAEAFAATKGIVVKDADVSFEYELALRRLFDPLAVDADSAIDRAEAERFLDAVLAERFMSREEYMLTIRRNACLRKVVEPELAISDGMLRNEFDVVYGERMQLRHIQLGSLVDAARVRERIEKGEDFAQLATRYSANASTARNGGLLDAFSPADEAYPAAFRQAAAKLSPGQVSDLVRVGEWFHVLRLERLVPAETRAFDDVRESLRRRVSVRLADARMRSLYERLVRESEVRIDDPLLREQFRGLHPDLIR